MVTQTMDPVAPGWPGIPARWTSSAKSGLGKSPAAYRSVGFVGFSDGWQELRTNSRLTRTYRRAENGYVAVTGEIDLAATDGVVLVALGFGSTAMEAGQHTLISLLEDFDRTRAAYFAGWKSWHKRLRSNTSSRY